MSLNKFTECVKFGVGLSSFTGGFAIGWRGVYSRAVREEVFYNHLENIDIDTINEAYEGMTNLYEVIRYVGVGGGLMVLGGALMANSAYNLCKIFREENK